MRKILLAAVMAIAATQDLWAEGSRDLYTSTSSGYRSYLMARGIGNSQNFDPYSNSGVIRVYAQAGEVIYAGSSMVGKSYASTTKANIIMKAPNGTTYTLSSAQLSTAAGSRLGLIENRTEELAGPNRTGVTSGYTPFTHTVAAGEGGIWEIQFTAPGTGSNIPTPTSTTTQHPAGTFDGNTYTTSYNGIYNANAGSWVQPVGYGASSTVELGLILAWDVSVTASAASGDLIPGRAYSTVLNLTGPNSVFTSSSFYGKLIVLTPSGYSYTVDANGMNGASFNFFSNNKGVIATSGNFASSSSFKSYNSSTYSGTLQNLIWDPRQPDDTATNNFTNKIFYNKPASDMPSTAATYYSFTTDGTSGGTAYGTKNTWLNVTPLQPTISNLQISCGGMIRFTSNVKGTFRILIDCDNNGNFEDAVDRTITNQATAGLNSYLWDRKNGSGTLLANNTNVSIKVYITTAEVHFPLIDMEANTNGFKINQNDLSHNAVASQDTVYWSDESITVATDQLGSSPQINITYGRGSTANGHKWGTSSTDGTTDTKFYGNNRTMDTWAFVNTNTAGTTSTCVAIYGNVYNDTDANVNVNASGGTALPTGLYATLVATASPPTALQPVAVANGTYEFTGMANGSYRVILTTAANQTASSLPSGWSNTGEDCCDASGNDGTVNGQVDVTVSGNTSLNYADFGIKATPITVSGSLWDDANGDAVKNTGESFVSGNNTSSTGTVAGGAAIYAYLTANDGTIYQRTQISASGTYSLTSVPPSIADLKLVISTQLLDPGASITSSTLPSGWTWTAETVTGNTASQASPGDGMINLTTTSSSIANQNFGIEQLSTADAKTFTASNTAFTVSNSVLINAQRSYAINGNSAGLTGSSPKSLSGSDPEDCSTASSCASGKTYSIRAINSNTRLFYDFSGGAGTDVREITTTTNNLLTAFSPSLLTIYGATGSGQSASPIGFTYSLVDNAGKIGSAATYALTTTSTALPVDLADFSLVTGSNNVLLQWSTGSESDLARFRVERSQDGATFHTIALVQGLGSNNTYQYRDGNLAGGNYYYRILLEQINGATLTSRVIGAIIDQNMDFRLWPNPAIGELTVAGIEEEAVACLYDAYGRLLYTYAHLGNGDKIDVSHLVNGSYVLKLQDRAGAVRLARFYKL